MMVTRFSFATRPPTTPTVACHTPKPSGRKMNATAPPIAASRESLLSSTMPKPLSVTPKACRNQMTTALSSITVPARFMKLQPRSQVALNTLDAAGA